jgi:hypothetical protein
VTEGVCAASGRAPLHVCDKVIALFSFYAPLKKNIQFLADSGLFHRHIIYFIKCENARIQDVTKYSAQLPLLKHHQ